MDNIKLFLLDLDGTVYVDGVLVKGAVETITKIRESGRKICFLTNNSSRTAENYVEKLNKLGISVDLNEVYTSGNSTARFLLNHYSKSRVYLMGNAALKNEFKELGVRVVEDKPDIVVVAYDTTLTYKKLTKTARFILEGAAYIATHSDAVCPAHPVYIPDAGSFIALLEKSTGRSPEVICGKPFTPMAEAVVEKFNYQREEIAMVGDRLSTDILFAINNGLKSVLVFTGETTKEMHKKSGFSVDYALNSIFDIVNHL